MSLVDVLEDMGFFVIDEVGTGKHIRYENFSLEYFSDGSEDPSCIKIYMRFKKDVEDKIRETVEALRDLLIDNKILMKYDENGRILKEVFGYLMGLEDGKSGYNICIYVPYNEEILKEVLGRIKKMEGQKKIFLGKTLFHRKVPLGIEDLKKIVESSLDKIYSEMKIAKRMLDIYDRIKENVESTNYFVRALSKVVFGREYSEGIIKEGKIIVYGKNRMIEKSFSEKERLLAKKLAYEMIDDMINEYKIKLEVYRNYIRLADRGDYINAIKEIQKIGKYSFIKFEGNKIYIEGKGSDLVDGFMEDIAEEKKLAKYVSLSYIPSKKDWAEKIENMLKSV